MLALALQSAITFNLVCTGSMLFNGIELPDQTILRVALNSARFCFADCRRVERIARVT